MINPASAAWAESDRIPEIIAGYGSDPDNLVQILAEIQHLFGHISEEAVKAVSTGLWIPRARVISVIEFYAFLKQRPGVVYEILFSDSITDQMLGKDAMMNRLCKGLGIAPGEASDTGIVVVDNTSCTGMCDQGPAALVNGLALTALTPQRIDWIVELVQHQIPLDRWPPELFETVDNLRRTDILLARDFTQGDALKHTLAAGNEAVLAAIEDSGLRGMGGAGFATGKKWRVCRDTPADRRVVVCNADEGEPGTFKDRVLLASYADLVIEGMTVCGRIIGAQRGYVYLRGEYRYMRSALETVIERRRQAGLLGCGILGARDFSFEVEICLGAGAYVCGEESALLESLEGKRGVSRTRPPFPVVSGYRGSPTVVNNVETFAAAAKIALHGGHWYASQGTEESRGTKILSVSGDCERRGIYEYPFGVSVRRVLEDCGAADVQAVQVAGPAGELLAPAEFDRRIAYEDVPTGGSFMVFNSERDMLQVTRNFVRFFAHESCGFCTPCRVGTSLMRDLVEKVYTGHGSELDLEEIRNLAGVLRHTSLCGLGQTASNPVTDLLKKFPDQCRQRLEAVTFEPAFDLDAALETARQLTGRHDKDAHL